jgi:tellurite resistance protein TehA-like permease
MTNYTIIAQIIVALSIVIVWVFRFHNVEKEFKEYGLSDVIRNIVGATKIALSTLLIAGIWFPVLVPIPSLVMAFLMISAQYFHFKAKHSWQDHLPSLFLLILCIFIAVVSLGLV